MCIHEQGRHLYIDLNLCYGDFRGRRLFTGRLQQQCLAIRRLQAPATTVATSSSEAAEAAAALQPSGEQGAPRLY